MSYFNERVFKTIPIDSFEDLKKYMRRCHAFVIDNEEYYPRLVSRDKNNGQWMVKAGKVFLRRPLTKQALSALKVWMPIPAQSTA